MCKRSIVLAVCLSALFFGQSAFAYLIVEDTFTQNETRIAGGALDGTFTEVGNREWYNRANEDCYRFVDPDGIPGNEDDNIRRASGGTTIWVALVDYVPAPAGETLTVSGDFYMNAVATNNESQQAALALFPSTTNVGGAATVTMENCTLAVRIYNASLGDPQYTAQLLVRKSTTEKADLFVYEQSILDNLDAAWQPMAMTYNTATGILNATINGNPLFTNVDVLSLIPGWTPDIAYAGFYLRNENHHNRFDNFQIESSVPEPATLILLGLGGLGLLRRRR